jgi:hypothetical protein
MFGLGPGIGGFNADLSALKQTCLTEISASEILAQSIGNRSNLKKYKLE